MIYIFIYLLIGFGLSIYLMYDQPDKIIHKIGMSMMVIIGYPILIILYLVKKNQNE